MALAVIAGLGNPGPDYANTRHNIGEVAVRRLAQDLGLSWKKEKATKCEVARGTLDGQPVTLLCPLSYMNESGQALGAFANYHKLLPDQFVVAYDDITLDIGRLKLSQQGSAGGHNGISDIIRHLGPGFIRYRIGIGAKSHPQMDLKDWVLGRFTVDETKILDEQMATYLDGFRVLWREGIERAMNQINTRNSKEKSNERNSNPTPIQGNLHSRPPGLPRTGGNPDGQNQADR